MEVFLKMTKVDDKAMIQSFTNDEYKYKYIRMSRICSLCLKIAGMTNAVIGGVVALLEVFL